MAPQRLTGAGRFAPTPSGPLHFGSLVAALASYVQARQQDKRWYVRMDDLDPPREVAGAADDILRTLEAYGLGWDGAVLYQSRRGWWYEQAIDQLARRDAVFPCGCSRREVARGPLGAEGPIYPGTCRAGLPPGRRARSLRLRVDAGAVVVHDLVQGRLQQDLARDIGDFVVRRADGGYAYQLANVVDDAWLGITEVVRGADLLLSTPRQVLLQRLLGFPNPEYAHLPVVLGSDHAKLAKSNGAVALDKSRPAPVLVSALNFLGQAPPADLRDCDCDEVLAWAIQYWRMARVPRVADRYYPQHVYEGWSR
ncbi:MAG: tRNA glutamyl-Q(34) synthetase GluQRS [Salinisphaera sp.]|nr:tRNA glutamyl-Q(34) synthetase GluQRS [Salinisphaera sp.]